MKFKFIFFSVIAAAAAFPTYACDSKGIEKQVLSLTSVFQESEVTVDASNIALKYYLLGCGQYQGMGSNDLIEVQSQLKIGKDLLKTEETKIVNGTPDYADLEETKRSKLLSIIGEATAAIDTSLKKTEEQAALGTCDKHKKGKLWELTNKLYESRSEAAETAMTNYVSSCVATSSSMSRDVFTSVGDEFKEALAWVNQTIAITYLNKQNKLNLAQLNLAHPKVELERGVNIFTASNNGWSDPHVSYFYIGYEGTTVDDVEKKGSARTGLYIYNQFNSLNETCPPKPGSCRQGNMEKSKFFLVFPHVYGNIFQSSSAESSTTTTTGTGTTHANVVNSMEVNTGLFWPIFAHQQEAHEDKPGVLAAGFLAERGWKTNEGSQNFIQRSYYGLRLAFSPDSYFDFIQGETEGRKGNRTELRGQYPLTNFSIGRLMLGGAMNYDNQKKEINTDSMRVYLIYHASFSDVFGGAEK